MLHQGDRYDPSSDIPRRYIQQHNALRRIVCMLDTAQSILQCRLVLSSEDLVDERVRVGLTPQEVLHFDRQSARRASVYGITVYLQRVNVVPATTNA